VGDEAVATVITCRERRAESQGHAKRLAKIQKAAIPGHLSLTRPDSPILTVRS